MSEPAAPAYRSPGSRPRNGPDALQASPGFYTTDMRVRVQRFRRSGQGCPQEDAKIVKELRPDMPVMLLTDFCGMVNICGKKTPGVDVVPGKPALNEEVVEALRQALETKAKYSAK